MGMEYSPARRKRNAKRRKSAQVSRTWGGPVLTSRIGDPQVTPPLPEGVEKRRRVIEEKRARIA